MEQASASSISFTLRLRAARMLKASQNERVEVAQLISSLYALRSKGAHDGHVPTSVSGKDSETILEEGAHLVAAAIKQIIRKGEPDWNTVFYG